MYRVVYLLLILSLPLWVDHGEASCLHDHPLDCSRAYVPSSSVEGHSRLMAREAAAQVVEQAFDPAKAVLERVETAPGADKRKVNFLCYSIKPPSLESARDTPWPSRPVYLLILYHFRDSGYGVVYRNGEFTSPWLTEKLALISPAAAEDFANGRRYLVCASSILQQGIVSLDIVGWDNADTVEQHGALFDALLPKKPSSFPSSEKTEGKLELGTISLPLSKSASPVERGPDERWDDSSEADPVDLSRIQTWLREIIMPDKISSVVDQVSY